MVNRWTGGGLTRRPKVPFAVSWQGNLVNKMKLQLRYLKQSFKATISPHNLWQLQSVARFILIATDIIIFLLIIN